MRAQRDRAARAGGRRADLPLVARAGQPGAAAADRTRSRALAPTASPSSFTTSSAHHRLLYGKDVISGAGGRRFVLPRAGGARSPRQTAASAAESVGHAVRPNLLRRLLLDSVSTFCVLFRHALLLHGVEAPPKKREVIAQAARSVSRSTRRRSRSCWTSARSDQAARSGRRWPAGRLSAGNRRGDRRRRPARKIGDYPMKIALIVILILVVARRGGLRRQVRQRAQRSGHAARSRRRAVVAGGRGAAAPRRPDPEPGGDGEGLRQARDGGLHEHRQRARRAGRRARRRRRRSRPTISSRARSRACWWSSENYPQLRSNENFCGCRTSWRARKIASPSSAASTTRRCSITILRSSVFPDNIVGVDVGFHAQRRLFQHRARRARQAPKVQF